MKWERGYRSSDVEDRRGSMGLRSGLFGPIVAIGSRFGIVGIVAAVGLYFAGQALLGSSSPLSALQPAEEPRTASNGDQLGSFVAFVFDDAQKVWTGALRDHGKVYDRARLVLFTDQTSSACGYGSAAVGPFYCPADQRVYIDLGFYRELARRFGAPGDFAQAYVIAHEVSHHVQTLTGVTQEVTAAASQDPSISNELSIPLELQADCLAGVWAHSTYERGLLESGDLEEGLAAAAAVGDDRIQAKTTGRIDPETWTHGTSEQRAGWFLRGFERGEAAACDTFESEL